MIPFQNFSESFLVEKNKELNIIEDVLSSGQLILGKYIDSFEEDWGAYTGANECVSVANGLDALVLALRGLGIGPGSRVAVPANTFIATWLAVSAVKATIVPVDPDPVTYNTEVECYEALLEGGEKIDAIIPVHLYGRPIDMDAMSSLCHRYNIKCIEDAAQAHGATVHGKKIGAHSDAVCWSFYPGKNLGGIGDGGAITTNNKVLAEYLRKLRNYGSSQKYHNEFAGINSRLDAVNAAVLSSRINRLDTENFKRQRNADIYLENIVNDNVVVPAKSIEFLSVWHQFVLQVDDRYHFQKYMEDNGISTMVHYPIPPYRQQAYADHGFHQYEYPITNYISDRIVSLPVNPFLSESNTLKISNIVNSYEVKK